MTESQDIRTNTDARHVANLTSLIHRLVYQLRKYDRDNSIAGQAMGYLRRAGIQSLVVRETIADSDSD